ncbi:MAG: hypothetical protein ACRDUV_14065 [Pseudonocardiaceae bacterium]
MAWLDCDVVLRDPDWPSKALAKLEDAILVQPFSSAYEVRLAGKGDPLPASPVGRTRPSFAARYAKRELSPEEIRTWRIGDDPVPITAATPGQGARSRYVSTASTTHPF